MPGSRERLVVRVARDGTIEARTQGIRGARCLDYIAVLEDVLEARTTSSAFTDEYSATVTTIHDEVRDDLHQR